MLTYIPVLPNLIHLHCQNCPTLTRIPFLLNLINLKCWDCPDLTNIPFLPNLEQLDMSNCMNVQSISLSDTVFNFVCSNNENLIINNFPPNLYRLIVNGVQTITQSLPVLNELHDLCCSDCLNITGIPSFNSLTYFECCNCPNLTHISDLPQLHHLECHRSPKLKTIGNIEQIAYLDCHNCPNLYSIKNYHDLSSTILRENCFWLNIKEQNIIRAQNLLKKYIKRKNFHTRLHLIKRLPLELVNMIV
jgi:hypothetical protein